jgi:DNA polymerase I-like protein with 3'-5' exonuclease and polymerase domains
MINMSGDIFTIELGALIDCLRRQNHTQLPSLLEFSDALRIRCGRPKDEVGEKPWNAWRQLASSSGDKERIGTIHSVFQSRITWPDRNFLVKELNWLALEMHRLWQNLDDDLRSQDEHERFYRVEAPVRRMLNGRQLAGVRVNQGRLDNLIKEVEAEKYAAFLRIAPAIGRSPQNVNYWNIGSHLATTELAHLASIDDAGAMRDSLKLAGAHSELARALVSYVDSVRDEGTLKRCAGSAGLVFPLFQGHGTVTGRILVSEPPLQQLRSKYRGIVSPSPGSELIYLDYAQFEPGVVAFLSNDSAFIQAYNQGDLYASLSDHLYGASHERKRCKQIFLAYCYGMHEDSIVRLMLPRSAPEHEITQLSGAIRGFFANFPGLVNLRADCETLLQTQGWISSLMGNRRYRGQRGALTQKERRWSLNQRIQATASLIFKEAISNISSGFGWESFILPMHDAILLETPANGDSGAFEGACTKAMEQAFSNRLPGVFPRVVRSTFSTE